MYYHIGTCGSYWWLPTLKLEILVCRIVRITFSQTTTPIANDSISAILFWYKMAPRPIVLTSITSMKGLVKSAKARIEAETHKSLIVSKALLHFSVQWTLILVIGIITWGQIVQWLGDLGISFDKASVIIDKSQETLYLSNSCWNGPLLYGIDLFVSAWNPCSEMTCTR